MTIAQNLDIAIRAVCPIHGVSIGRQNDKTTWKVDFKNTATSSEKAAAQGVIDSFVYSAPEKDDLDQVQKDIKALALCVAQVGGLTVPQMKALFKQKWNSLP